MPYQPANMTVRIERQSDGTFLATLWCGRMLDALMATTASAPGESLPAFTKRYLRAYSLIKPVRGPFSTDNPNRVKWTTQA